MSSKAKKRKKELTLGEVATQLGIHYKEWKAGEKKKEKVRPTFLKLVTSEVDESTLAQKTVEIPLGYEGARGVTEYVETYFPGWKILTHYPDLNKLLIQEDPAFVSVSYVNREDGMVYTRQVSSGGVEIDDARLREEDPDLWNEITYFEWHDWLADLLYESGVDNTDVDERINRWLERPGAPKRQLKDLDTLPEETQAKVQRYLHWGKPTIKLAPPRKATEEELDVEEAE